MNDMRKYVQLRGDEANLGRIYPDGSHAPCIRLLEENGIFQIRFFAGSDIAYSFLPECTELLDILSHGIVGVTAKQIAEKLIELGYEEIL